MANRSLCFNGKNSDVIIKHQDFYNVFPFSIQCWIKTVQNNNSHCSIINKYINGSGNGWSLNIINGKISFWIFNNNHGCDFIGKTLVNDNAWHNIIITVSDKVKIYIDSILDVETSSNINSSNTNSTNIVLGLYQGINNRYNGLLDDFSFWSTELDSETIVKYAKGIRINENSEYLNGHWDMNKIVDNQIIDSAKSNYGTITNIELALDGYPAQYYKYLIRKENNYYSLKSSFNELGQPKDNTELEQWYKEDGVDDLNVLVKKNNNKSIDLKLNENDIYKTIIPINFNEITDKIEYINRNNKKEIKYNIKEYQLLDLIKKQIGNKFEIRKWEEK